MKSLRFGSLICAFVLATVGTANAASTFTLNPLLTFGPNGDGSIKPGQSIGISPLTGNTVRISAPGADLTGGLLSPDPPYGFGYQPGDEKDVRAGGATNGFNMRGLAFDPVTQNLIFVDTHGGSGGIQTNPPNSAIYILDGNTGQIIDTLTPSIATLNSAGVTNTSPGGGIGPLTTPGIADDGVVYVCCQVNQGASDFFKIWRWPTADTNSPSFTKLPTLAVSTTLSPVDRIGQTLAVRGSGTNTLIIVGTTSSSLGGTAGTGTNCYIFTTADGTNFTTHRLSFPGITNSVFNDGIAFGPTNTFFTKQVGQPLNFLAWDPVTFAGSVIATYRGSSPNDPLLNLSAIAYDPVNRLLAGMEEIGGNATSGNGKIWLYDFSDPTNHAPAILATRVWTVNFQKTTAPMGYLAFGNGRLYGHASNNGFLCSTVDSVAMSPPTYTWTDYKLDGTPYTRVSDLPATTRSAVGLTVHFEVFAVPDVTNYQWYSNNVLISGANSYYLDVPNVGTNYSGSVYRAVALNAAGSSNSVASTLQVVQQGDFFHLSLLWSITANTIALNSPTNFITSSGTSTAPNERSIAYNALSNQLLVVRGPTTLANVKVFVISNPEQYATNSTYPGGFPTNNVYTLNTTGITSGQNLSLGGIGVADDGAVYASSAGSDNSFKIYRWADTSPTTVPVVIFGTNSSAGSANPIANPLGSTTFRFGDNLAVRGSGINTEIILDAQNSTKWAAILTPTDSTMTNWSSIGYLLQNSPGSYGSQAYGTTIGRSLYLGNGATYWQKRYNSAGSPLAEMSYTPGGGGVSPLVLANTTSSLYSNAQTAINFNLKVAVAINFATGLGSISSPDTLYYYDLTDPSQAVLLGVGSLPGANSGGRLANNSAIAQVIFGANPVTGTNYIFALDANNGIQAYTLAGGVNPPPRILVQPKNLRLLQGGSGSMGVQFDQVVTTFWYKGTNSPVYTGIQGFTYAINNAQNIDAGDYFVVATNLNGAVTSVVAHVSVGVADDNYSLVQAWAATPGNVVYPYVTSDGGPNIPNERAFAFNAPSNQLIVVRCPPGSTAYTLWVVDAATGTQLYTMNTAGVLHEGLSEVSGANAIDLVGAAASEDGSIYICAESPNASGGALGDTTKMWNLYRWANSAPTTAPVLVFQGDPSGQPAGANYRWGDVLTARGGGTNTELFVNTFEGAYAAVLKPTDNTLNVFSNYWFGDSGGGGSIGRSVQFLTNNTVFEKRKGSSLVLSSYDTNAHTSTILASYDSSSTLGGVWVDSLRALAAGVDFVGTPASKPDAVALYEVSDPTSALLISRYNFPVNQNANNNVICQTIIAGNRVYSLDSNNGLVAFNIAGPRLAITPAPNNKVILSWGPPGLTLQATASIAPPVSWSSLGAGTLVNGRYTVTNSAAGQMFYRLYQ